jgi:uncharacterized RDD family membrane protein YckC
MQNELTHPKASPQHRLGGYALDIALILSTCYIGWFIWSLVIWGQGLTPGKQILKLRVVATTSGKSATWGHMAVRQVLIPMAMTLPFSILQLIFQPYLFDSNFWAEEYYDYSFFDSVGSLGSVLVGLLSFGVALLDGFWIFKGGQNRRITDLWAKTDVINTSVSLR